MDQGLAPLRIDPTKSRAGLDRDERLVKDGILRMGSLVEAQIRDAVQLVLGPGFSGVVPVTIGAPAASEAPAPDTTTAAQPSPTAPPCT